MKTIGIDIGGSKIRGILWDEKRILKSSYFKIPKKQNVFEKKIKNMVQHLVGPNKILKIGIGTAGKVDGTKVVRARNIPYFNNFDFQKIFPKIIVRVDNDARTYARTEYKIGDGKRTKSMLMMTLGTGIGRAFVKNGNVLKIRRFEYAEDWEKEYQKIHSKKALAEFLGEKLAPIIFALDPEIVVLGGGVIEKKGYFQAIKKQLSPTIGGAKLKIKHSKLGKFAGAIGAAMLWN